MEYYLPYKNTNYLVSNYGNVKNLKTNKILNGEIIKKGYIRMYLGYNFKNKVLAHRMVAETFIPNPDNKPTVNHIDGNKLNNHVSNLEWNTYSENLQHAFDNNLKNCISKRKLSNADVLFIRNNYKPYDKEYGCRPLSRRLNVDTKCILGIINKITYK